ncbi:sulfurtransferase TusA family protein [Alkalilimnicola ehrlichii]|uniref:sulfurtransferase TusA family protein n=1 Tax=Alkalilimnicola ehrlichii TaxID=351052 RepID=UPI003B9ECA7C
MDYDEQLDVRGLSCPMPILQTKRRLLTLAPGQVLWVRATDPHAPVDFMAYTERSNHELLRQEETAGEFQFWIRRGEEDRG